MKNWNEFIHFAETNQAKENECYTLSEFRNFLIRIASFYSSRFCWSFSFLIKFITVENKYFHTILQC